MYLIIIMDLCIIVGMMLIVHFLIFSEVNYKAVKLNDFFFLFISACVKIGAKQNDLINGYHCPIKPNSRNRNIDSNRRFCRKKSTGQSANQHYGLYSITSLGLNTIPSFIYCVDKGPSQWSWTE